MQLKGDKKPWLNIKNNSDLDYDQELRFVYYSRPSSLMIGPEVVTVAVFGGSALWLS